MGRDLMVNQPTDTATEAHKLVGEAGEAIKASRETIKAALRGMGVASDISEISCLAGLPRPPPARPSMGNLAPPAWPPRGHPANPAWPPQGTLAASVWPPPDMPPRATPGGAGDELANLMRGLMGAQANDSRWPTFSRKYVEYPRFQERVVGVQAHRRAGVPQSQGEESGQQRQDPGKRHRGSAGGVDYTGHVLRLTREIHCGGLRANC
jgi:hypothetical protein